VSEDVAKHQARQFEQVFEAVGSTTKAEIQNRELATKHDIRELDLKLEQVRSEFKSELKSEISRAKYEMITWVAGMLLASVLIQHFFK
jgi:hypothetical protein